jgi:hypothetical protein
LHEASTAAATLAPTHAARELRREGVGLGGKRGLEARRACSISPGINSGSGRRVATVVAARSRSRSPGPGPRSYSGVRPSYAPAGLRTCRVRFASDTTVRAVDCALPKASTRVRHHATPNQQCEEQDADHQADLG